MSRHSGFIILRQHGVDVLPATPTMLGLSASSVCQTSSCLQEQEYLKFASKKFPSEGCTPGLVKYRRNIFIEKAKSLQKIKGDFGASMFLRLLKVQQRRKK